MQDVPTIDLEDAEGHFSKNTALFVDVRAAQDVAQARIPRSQALSNANAEQFVTETAKDQAIVVYCYHGNSSKMVTAFLLEQGFENVWSLNGGFEAWRQKYEINTSS